MDRTTWRRAWWASVGINLVGGIPCLVSFLVWVSPAAVGKAPARSTVVFSAAFAVYVGAIAVTTSSRDTARRRLVDRWLDAGAPSGGDHAGGREVVLAEPMRQALSTGLVWLGGCGIFAAIDLWYVRDPLRSALLLCGALMAGLTTVMVTFFTTERLLQSLLSLAMTGPSPPATHALTVRRRLQLAWFVGSGIPVAGIGLTLLWQELMATDMRAPLFALVGAGLLAGWIVMGVAGRSVAEPLEAVRSGLAHVEEGDLSSAVAVTSRTEIGLLQAGFNTMVAGLRERERIRQLFGAQVSQPVAAATISGATGFDGRICDASVLFVDLIGSTALVQARSAGDVVLIVNQMIEAVVGCVEHEGGFVARIQGDGALCVFGALGDAEDHAGRALRAAVALRQRIAGPGPVHPGLDVGIAVASGPMVAGLVGTANRHEFGLVGDPLNEASRLCDAAKQRPGRLLATEAAVRAAGNDDGRSWAAAASFALRGRSQLTVAYEPVHGAVLSEARMDAPLREDRHTQGSAE